MTTDPTTTITTTCGHPVPAHHATTWGTGGDVFCSLDCCAAHYRASTLRTMAEAMVEAHALATGHEATADFLVDMPAMSDEALRHDQLSHDAYAKVDTLRRELEAREFTPDEIDRATDAADVRLFDH